MSADTPREFAAYDPELDRKVAIKLLLSERRDADARARLLREAQAMARLSHAHVVHVHDVGTTSEGDVFVAMEFIEGSTLGGWLRAAPRSVDEILSMYRDAGAGLAAAHAAGLTHRDFKPDIFRIAQVTEQARKSRGERPRFRAGSSDRGDRLIRGRTSTRARPAK